MNTLLATEAKSLALTTSALKPLRSTKAAASQTSEEKLKRLGEIKKACQDVESVFVSSLVKALRQTIPSGGFMAETAGSDIYEGMVEQQLSQYLSQGVGVGLGQTVFNQMVRKEKLEDVAASVSKTSGGYAKIVPADLMPHHGLKNIQTTPQGISLSRNSSDQGVPATETNVFPETAADDLNTGHFTGGL